MAGTRKCSTCEQVKPLTEFYPRRNRGLVEWQHQCKECNSARARSPEYRAWMKQNYAKKRKVKQDAVFRARFQISQEELESLRANSNGVCAICGNQETAMHSNGRIRSLAIDHDHGTGQVRGMLCNYCNRGLAAFKDNPETLAKAIKYLSNPPAVELLTKLAKQGV